MLLEAQCTKPCMSLEPLPGATPPHLRELLPWAGGSEGRDREVLSAPRGDWSFGCFGVRDTGFLYI